MKGFLLAFGTILWGSALGYTFVILGTEPTWTTVITVAIIGLVAIFVSGFMDD